MLETALIPTAYWKIHRVEDRIKNLSNPLLSVVFQYKHALRRKSDLKLWFVIVLTFQRILKPQ